MNVESPRPGTARTAAATLLAPISWGTTYVTVTELLPDGRPLLVAAARVLPAGAVLAAAGWLTSRWRPRGSQWWRTGVLATFNFGIFFPLLVTAVYLLPGGVAAAAGGLQPLLVAVITWAVSGRRPRAMELAVGVLAVVGVGLVVVRPGAGLDPVGVLAAAAANVSFAIGVVLTKQFPAPSNRVASTGWQLLIGGLVLAPLTVIVEGAPPSLTSVHLVGFAYLGLVGTALAFVLWFSGIVRLPAAAPPLLGLAAPVTGAVLGWVVLGEALSPLQLGGFVLTIGAIAYGASLRDRGLDPRPAVQRLHVYCRCMARTNIDIDDDACRVVMRRYQLSTKREAVNFALRTLATEPLGLEAARDLRGSGWDGDLEELRATRVG